MLTAVSGVLTKQGVSLWSCEPAPRPFRFADASAETARALERAALVDDASGQARVVSYTVLFEGEAPTRTVLLCELADGRRSLAASRDPDLAATAVREELCGRRIVLGAHGALALA